MANIREEMQTIVDTAPTMIVPGGLTRAEFREWKLAQTARAKTRLKDLEERMHRLQLIETKMQRLKTSSNDAIDAVPEHWTLPGTADDGHGAADGFTRRAPSLRLVGACRCHEHARSI